MTTVAGTTDHHITPCTNNKAHHTAGPAINNTPSRPLTAQLGTQTSGSLVQRRITSKNIGIYPIKQVHKILVTTLSNGEKEWNSRVEINGDA